MEKIPPSTRKYPHIVWEPEKVTSKEFLTLKGVSKSVGGRQIINNVDLIVNKDDKLVLISEDSLLTTTMLQLLAGEESPDSGTIKWGMNVKRGYFPKDHSEYFVKDIDLVDWLRQFSENQEEGFVRTFLGRMLFTGEESKKSGTVLSGGEKVRCMLSKLMLENPQCMLLDGPTNHLDLESITALNNSLMKFPGTLIFASHDVEFIQTLADRVVELTPDGIIDRPISYEDYLAERAEALGLSSAA